MTPSQAPRNPGGSAITHPARPTSGPRRGVAAKLLLFLLPQLLLAAGLGGTLWLRARQQHAARALPELRETPRTVGPYYNDPVVISDDDLREFLRRTRPRFYGAETHIGHVDHNLRYRGAEVVFAEPEFVSGEQMRELLLNHERFAELYGPEMPPLLLEVPGGGVRVREFEGKGSASHDDHTMACLAEVGTPLGHPVITPNRRTTFRALVEQSLRDFSLNQVEYEWSAVTYALFLNQERWITSEGQQVSFDMLADRIMRQEMPQGVCLGNHRLHALTLLLRADEQWDGPRPMLSPAKRAEVSEYLLGMTARLVANQHEDGFWNVDWPTGKPASRQPSDSPGDGPGDRIIATGHALEWWALAPAELHPPRHVLVSAAQWLVRTLQGLNDEQVRDFEPFLSHAGRALALWRGKFPHEIDLADGAAPTPAQP